MLKVWSAIWVRGALGCDHEEPSTTIDLLGRADFGGGPFGVCLAFCQFL